MYVLAWVEKSSDNFTTIRFSGFVIKRVCVATLTLFRDEMGTTVQLEDVEVVGCVKGEVHRKQLLLQLTSYISAWIEVSRSGNQF